AATGWASVAIGALACAILVANNLRDLIGDRAVGKHTLATRLGDRGTRLFYVALVAIAGIAVVGVAATSSWWALLGLLMLVLLVRAGGEVLAGAAGRSLIPVLRVTGLAELVCSLGLGLGLVLGR
ncbi:MAG: UbiA family prenyltransferase, partial [Micropruina sp.]